NGIGEAEGGRSQAAKVYVAAKIKLENLRLRGAELHEIVVSTELESVLAADNGDMIGEFGAALDAVDRRVRLTSEIGEAGNVHTDIAAAGKLGKTKVQAAAGKLRAALVEIARTHEGGVLTRAMGMRGMGRGRERGG